MADASYPDDLLYHAEHDWVRLDGDTAEFGITWFAQDALGEKPEAINDDPYGAGWMVKVKVSDPSEQDSLLDREAYEASLQ